MKKKLLSILLVLSLMLALVPAAFAADIVDSGTCGADGDGSSVTWTLDAAGLLTISGTGKIIDGDGGSIWSGKPVMAVDIRSGITAVGSNAFFGCDQLQVISLPDTVTQLDKNAFGNCAALSSILVDAKNPAYKSMDGALYSKDGTVLIKCPADAETFVVPDGVTTIGDYAFFGAKSLKNVYFPEGSLTTIGAMAFEFCTGLTAVILPAGVTEIGMYAFAHCSKLRSIDLPVSLTHMGETAFLSVGSIEAGIADLNVNYAGTEQQWSAIRFDDSMLTWAQKHFGAEQHAFSVWAADGTRSCTEGMTMARSCGNDGCDLIQAAELPALGHVVLTHEVELEPDGIRAGLVSFVCARCGQKHYLLTDPEIPASEQFTDVDETHWSYEGIQYCAALGLMSGTSDTTFAPFAVATRAQLVQILYSMEGEPDMTGVTTPFVDAQSGWYRDAVAWAYQNNVITGTSATTFSPNDPVTREQITVVLMGFLMNVYAIARTWTPADLAKFPDGGSVSGWARTEMADAVALGLIGGAEIDGTLWLKPQGQATRAEIATIFEGMCRSVFGIG